MIGIAQQTRPTYWIAFEPLPERDYIISLRVSLPDLLVVEGIRTLADLHTTLVELPPESFVVVDSLDTMPIGAERRLTAGTQGVYAALQELGSLRSALVDRGISVLLISQLRYAPKKHAIGSSASGMESVLTAALNVQTVRRETRFGEKQWSTLEVHNKRHNSWPPGSSGIMYTHPELGISPEMELLQEARERWGTTWRSHLSAEGKFKLPNGYVAAAKYLRENPSQFDDLWRLLWQKSG